MAKKTKEEALNLDNILFKCRDILRQAKNSGSFFEKRDMMLTLVFLRFIGEKYENGVANLRQKLIAEGLDPDNEDIRKVFFDDATFADGTFDLPDEARWSTIINTAAPQLNVALDTALRSIGETDPTLKGCFVEGTFTQRNLGANDMKKIVDEVNKISHKAFGEEKDLIGRVYEYFLKEFAVNATKEEGEFYTPHESNANYAWILHMLSHLKTLSGVAGFLLANGALGDTDALEIRKKLIQNDKVEAIIILPRELFITTDISVTFWILNQNKKDGKYHGRQLRNRENEILFMDLRRWTENSVKGEQKKKVQLTTEQIQRVADIYHQWQQEGTDGKNFAVPELYRGVGIEEIEQNNWTLVPSKYIEFIDHDLEIDYPKEMARIQHEMKALIQREKESQRMLEEAFRGIGYSIE